MKKRMINRLCKVCTGVILLFALTSVVKGVASAQIDEIATPFTVQKIKGTISYGDGKPLLGADFEIATRAGTVAVGTGMDGKFELTSFRFLGPFVRSAAVPPGSYRFTVAKEGFRPTAGTVVVSPKAPATAAITIQLKFVEGYRGEETGVPPDERLLPLADAVSILRPSKHKKKYPEKYAVVYAPVSLAIGSVRTAEFPVDKDFYDIMLQVDKPHQLPFQRLLCMLGATNGPLETKDCAGNDPLLQADWTVWQDGHIIHWGSLSNSCHCSFTNENVFRMIGSFHAQAGRRYVVQVHFVKDGTPLNVANPHLIVIKHEDMW